MVSVASFFSDAKINTYVLYILVIWQKCNKQVIAWLKGVFVFSSQFSKKLFYNTEIKSNICIKHSCSVICNHPLWPDWPDF